MFKRRRAQSTPAPNHPPSSSASLAATKAFLQNAEANVELSNAAAAAALRTHPSGPTAVGETVTKRMVRKSSLSSHGSGSLQGLQAPALRRQTSSGSMTERSFRSPSPTRRHSPVVGQPTDVPPVPAVPKHVPTVSVAQRRASSLEPAFRGASSPRRVSGRGMSVDAVARIPATNPRIGGLSQVPEYGEDARPRSVNFSRPMSPSDTSSQTQTKRTGWFAAPVHNSDQGFREGPPQRPKTSSGNIEYDARDAFQTVQNASVGPVRKTRVSRGVEGARLASGSMGSRPTGTGVPIDPKSPDAVYDPSTRTFIRKRDAMAIFRELQAEEEPSPGPGYHYISPAYEENIPQRRLSQRAPATHHVQTRTPTSNQHRVSSLPHVSSQQDQPYRATPDRQPPPERYDDASEQYQEPQTQHRDTIVHEHDYAPSPCQLPSGGNKPRSQSTAKEGGLLLTRLSSEDLAGSDIRPALQSTLQHVPAAERERTEHEPSQPKSPVYATNQDSPFPRIGSPAHASVGEMAGRGRGGIRSDRGASLSPPRTAHFAAGTLELPNGVLHHPPPRSVSPAKSALKSSPSQSRRNSSPLANNGRVLSRGNMSEISDAVSEDSVGKRKKTVRVSFDEAPVIAGTSAYAGDETPPGLAKSHWSSTHDEEDLENIMRPRPALPSFGSVRNRRDADRDHEKVSETVSSSMANSMASVRDPIEASSDHALASIIAHDHARKQTDSQEPLPPEVTSVEGSGYYSDSGSSDTAHYEEVTPTKSQDAELPSEPSALDPKTLSMPAEVNISPAEVPVIAIQPATPKLSDKTEFLPEPKEDPVIEDTKPEPTPVITEAKPEPFIKLPGGWEDDDEAPDNVAQKPNYTESVPVQTAVPSVLTDSVQPAASAHITFAEPNVPDRAQTSEATDDDDSIYSDAYEELTDSENGGFASIDDVLESSFTRPQPGLMHSKFAGKGVDTKKFDTREGATQAPSIAPTKVDAVMPEITSPIPTRTTHPADSQTVSVPAREAKPTAQKKHAPEISKPTTTIRAKEPISRAQGAASSGKPSAQPRKSALKKTTAVAVAQPVTSQEPQLRKTMRGSPGPQTAGSPATGPMRTTMRATSEPRPANAYKMTASIRLEGSTNAAGKALGLAASRHSMPPEQHNAPRGALQKRNIPSAAPKHRPQSAVGVLSTAPVPKYDSDSDASASSFQKERKRKRAARGVSEGRYSMRRSMRNDATPTMRSGPSVRPMSPVSASSPPPPSFRRSMRPTSPISEPSAPKSSKFSIRSLSPTGRLLGKQPKSKAAAPTNPRKSALDNRFDDSSDDEDYASRPRRFQSRFADSDSDDDYQLPPDLAPVRGIPKRPGDDDRDSTDLEDEQSEDEEKKSTAASKNGPSGLSKSKHAPASPTTEKKPKAKRGFFGLGKKKEAPASPSQPTPTPQSTDIPLPPTHRDRSPNHPLTPIAEADDKTLEANPPTPRSPKLQRRNTPQWSRSASDSWPLPTPPPIGDDARPATADGLLDRTDSHAPSHAPTARTAIDPKSGKEVVVGRTGKKKRFQGLRRVFGLND
ncbi:hypothetical protein M011DRAFT_461748 [Sporormia fimetaria CBS 119925]|uniref:Uncharacterized protein n=1 Tax=Sporormia fimetaria CBS 119925 TaxID=1340428 RepID=A0A6A6UYR8_9PLEO|nr:hypothetical protein M011DRAFT_461748 [Sporormia fimetaria CBS 119925]